MSRKCLILTNFVTVNSENFEMINYDFQCVEQTLKSRGYKPINPFKEMSKYKIINAKIKPEIITSLIKKVDCIYCFEFLGIGLFAQAVNQQAFASMVTFISELNLEKNINVLQKTY